MRICILRLSAIGDVTHALAVIRAIQDQIPNAQITWVIGKFEARLMANLEGVELIVFDKSAGWRSFQSLRKQLRRRRFDALLQMQVALRANLASLCIRSPRRIGYDKNRSKDLHGLFINERIASNANQHVQDALLSFVEPLGLATRPPRWDIPLDQEDREFAAQHLSNDRPSLVISPVSSHPLRNWNPKRYAAVADYAAAAHGFQVIVTGGPGPADRQMADSIISATAHPVTDLVGKDTLTKLAAMLGACDLVLAPDTGPMHIANAMGTQVLGLHAASNPRRSGPYCSIKWCVDRYDEAARRFKGKAADELPWGTKIEYPGSMDLISVADVTQRLDEWVSENLPSSSQ